MSKYIYELSTDSWQEGTLGYFSNTELCKELAHRERKDDTGRWWNVYKAGNWTIKRYPINEELVMGNAGIMSGRYDPETDTIFWKKKFGVAIEP